jgi:hypothetical protein
VLGRSKESYRSRDDFLRVRNTDTGISRITKFTYTKETVLLFSAAVKKIPEKNNLKEDRFIWLTVSEVSIHGQLVLLLLVL